MSEGMIDLGPFEFFERYRALPEMLPIRYPVQVAVPIDPSRNPFAHIVFCGEHVHAVCPPDTGYAQLLAVLTQAYVVARALTQTGGAPFGHRELALAAAEVARGLEFGADDAAELQAVIARWHDAFAQVTAGRMN